MVGLNARLLLLVRLRWWLALPATLVTAVATRHALPLDLDAFSRAGANLLTGRLDRVYAGAWNQAGPVQLIGSRLLMLGGRDGHPALFMFVLVDLGLLAGLAATCRRLGVSAPRQLVVAGLTIVYLAGGGLWSGHPVEVVIPVLWLAGAGLARRGRWAAAGALLGLAALVAPWAILAMPVAFVAPPGRSGRLGASGPAVRTVLLASAGAVGGYLPFVATGHFAMLNYAWPIYPGSALHLLMPGLVRVNWALRLVQGALVVGGCLFVAARRGADGRWLAPMAAVLLRIVLDPTPLTYYWLPIGVLLIGALVLGAELTPRLRLAGWLLLGYSGYVGLSGGWPVPCALGGLAGLALVWSGRVPAPVAAWRRGGEQRLARS